MSDANLLAFGCAVRAVVWRIRTTALAGAPCP